MSHVKTFKNEFHGTESTFYVAHDGTVSNKMHKRIKNELCGIRGCRCFFSPDRSEDIEKLVKAQPIFAENSTRIVAWKMI